MLLQWFVGIYSVHTCFRSVPCVGIDSVHTSFRIVHRIASKTHVLGPLSNTLL